MPEASRKIRILANMVPQRAYWRGVLEGAARYCKDNPEVQLRHPVAEWELVGDPEIIDGVITVISDEASKREVLKYGKPVVNVSSITANPEFPTVMMDNLAVGALAADHLLAQGYAHFAYHRESRVYFSNRRYEGFAARIEQAHKTCHVFDTAPLTDPHPSAKEQRAWTAQWLLDLPKPVGLFTHSDVRAAMLIDICQEAGLRVPTDVGVIGCDNDGFVTETVHPTLSSVDLSADVVGYDAAALLVRLIHGDSIPQIAKLVPPRRVEVRESTQPARLDDELLDLALEFIRENASKAISVDDVISAAATSRRTLERRFREHLGRSPADEIRRVRMEHARKLLLNSEKSLAWIARVTGYTNLRNFATAFRRENGMSPTAYRKRFLLT